MTETTRHRIEGLSFWVTISALVLAMVAIGAGCAGLRGQSRSKAVPRTAAPKPAPGKPTTIKPTTLHPHLFSAAVELSDPAIVRVAAIGSDGMTRFSRGAWVATKGRMALIITTADVLRGAQSIEIEFECGHRSLCTVSGVESARNFGLLCGWRPPAGRPLPLDRLTADAMACVEGYQISQHASAQVEAPGDAPRTDPRSVAPAASPARTPATSAPASPCCPTPNPQLSTLNPQLSTSTAAPSPAAGIPWGLILAAAGTATGVGLPVWAVMAMRGARRVKRLRAAAKHCEQPNQPAGNVTTQRVVDAPAPKGSPAVEFPASPARDTREAREFLQLSRLEGRDPLHDALVGRFALDELDAIIDRDGPDGKWATKLRKTIVDRFNEMVPFKLEPQHT